MEIILMTFNRISHKWTALLICILALAACQQETPEERLKANVEAVENVQEDHRSASEDVVDAASALAARKQSVDDAEAALAKARKELRGIQKELEEEQKLLQNSANDTAIFRLVQQKLLDAPELENSAVRVTVINGVITLDGQLNNQNQVNLAESIAKAAPGVKGVRNFLKVE